MNEDCTAAALAYAEAMENYALVEADQKAYNQKLRAAEEEMNKAWELLDKLIRQAHK